MTIRNVARKNHVSSVKCQKVSTTFYVNFDIFTNLHYFRCQLFGKKILSVYSRLYIINMSPQSMTRFQFSEITSAKRTHKQIFFAIRTHQHFTLLISPSHIYPINKVLFISKPINCALS